jgi:hypothetical protein
MLRSRNPSSIEQVATFFNSTVLPFVEANRLRIVVICAGELDPLLLARLQRVAQDYSPSMSVVTKYEALGQRLTQNYGLHDSAEPKVMVNAKGKVVEQWTNPFSGPKYEKSTSTRGAAVDLILMERAAVAIATTTSSFSAAVYAKRCGGASTPGCSAVGRLFLYDTYRDGSFTRLTAYPCGYQFGQYLRSPPALVARPPRSLHVVAFRFYGRSPLYEHPERNGNYSEKTADW